MSNHERDRHADTVIRNHTLFSMASGAIPVALADIAAVSAVQLDMIRQLCDVYGIDFQATRGKALVTAITSAAIARAGAASLVKLVPIAGTIVGSVSGGLLAGASSYALGQAFKTHLSGGGTFLDLDTDRLRQVYREQFEKGKEVVRGWQREREAAADANGSGPERRGFDLRRMRREPMAPAEAADATATANGASARDQRVRTEDAAGAPTAATTAAEEAPPGGSPVERGARAPLAQRLAALNELRREGLVDEEEYRAAKARLLREL